MKFYSKSTNAFYDDAINVVMPPDAREITDAQWQAALDGQSQGKTITADANGMPVAVVIALTSDQIKAAGEAAIQSLLDSTAQAHGYDSLERCISYIGDPVALWNSEGTRAKAWRSECWSKAKQIQDDATEGNWPTVGAGQIPSKDDVLAAMPPANWPTA